MTKQIIGWILLATGLAIIFWGAYSSYQIFTDKKETPEIFQIEKKETELVQPSKGLVSPEAMEEMIGEQLKGVLPLDFLPRLFNLIAWSIFAMILFFAGGQISTLGIKLIKC